MPLMLNDEQQMLAEAADGFVRENAPVAHLRALRDRDDERGYDPDLWTRFAQMGFAGVLVDETHGGSGLGAVEAGVIAEALGRTLAPTPYFSTGVLGAHLISALGSEAQREQWLSSIASGEALIAMAIDEHTKHRPQATALGARPSGNGFVLDGSKTFVVDGHVADAVVVLARTSGEAGSAHGLSLFLVDPATSGVGIERTRMVDSHNAARITFDKVQVAGDALIGPLDEGLSALQPTLDTGRACISAHLNGISAECFERTMEYLRTRQQFDRPIGSFQALQHRAAHLFTEIELSRAATLAALQRLDQDADSAAADVAIAKAKAGRVAELAVQEAVQMHGGIGMTDEHDIGLFMKRVRVAQEWLGDAAWHTEALARRHGY
ncbi:MAG: acyl-CoA dehydrogenase family protein [Brevundimonas sp.]|uniref:acyl-CoA dehydrogenase family protein n=1 Tax=Brevundimonas sp. TaxID=1871086 RepID=UPI0039191854